MCRPVVFVRSVSIRLRTKRSWRLFTGICLKLAKSLYFSPEGNLPQGSILDVCALRLGFGYFSRQRLIGSNVSSAKPSESNASMADNTRFVLTMFPNFSRIVFAPFTSASDAGTSSGGGGGGVTPRMFSRTHTTRVTGVDKQLRSCLISETSNFCWSEAAQAIRMNRRLGI